MSKKEIKEEEEVNNVENLYVSDEPVEFEVKGVKIKYKELSGLEFTSISDELNIDPSNPEELSSRKYMKKIIEKCVIEPKLDVEKLKTDVLLKIVEEVQGGLNIESELENLR